MAWKYILFDLDGTLTDSSSGIVNSIKYALTESGIPLPSQDTLLQFIGPPLVVGFQEILGKSEKEAVELTRKFRERYNKVGLFENEPYEGIKEILSILKENCRILAVATSKPEETAIRILKHFGLYEYFEVVTGSSPDGSRESKTLVIEETLRRLHLTKAQKDEIVMVGDRKHDILGAKQVQLASVGVYHGFAKPGELEEAGADYVAHDMSELKNILLLRE